MPNLKHIFDCLCTIETEGTISRSGFGSFIGRDTILTAKHIIEEAEALNITNARGQIVRVEFCRATRLLDNIDTAVISIGKSIAVEMALLASNVHDASGPLYLINTFQKATINLPTLYKNRGMDLLHPQHRAWLESSIFKHLGYFETIQETKMGYSGSPVFNESGEIVSLLTHADPKLQHLQKQHMDMRIRNGYAMKPEIHFFGPEPAYLASLNINAPDYSIAVNG